MKNLFLSVLAFTLIGLSQISLAQETVVAIGTGTGPSNGAPARPSSESYGQTLYYPAQVGMSGYITKLVYKRYDTQAYTNAMHWTVYLGTTTQTSFFGSLNYDDMIPVGNLTQVFDGNVEVTSTEVIVSFDTPFYYDGVDQLVVAVNELTLGKHYSYLKATGYGTQTNAPAKVALNLSTFASVNASSPLASSDQMQSTAEQANVDITFSTCLWPTAITATNQTTTTMDVGWTVSALNETAWQVEAVPQGQAQGTGVVQSAGTNPYTFTGLDHSTVYDFYVRADCGSNEYSEWKNSGQGITDCGVNTCFEAYYDFYNHLETVRCHTAIGAGGGGVAVGNPGDLSLGFGGWNGQVHMSFPEFASLNGGTFFFRGKSKVNNAPYNSVSYGTMSDPNNSATYTAMGTITMNTTWNDYSIDFNSYAGTDKYITIMYQSINGNSVIYMDDVQFDAGVCVYNKMFVDDDATGNNDGTSWANAYTDFRDAILNYNGDDIWVAAGTYTPSGPDRAAATFGIPNGAKIYGGFDKTEYSIDDRDVANNISRLSGDLNGDDNATLLPAEATRQDNSYHVISIKGDVTDVVLDGFTISGGNANGPTSNACNVAAILQYYHTRGGAIYAHPYEATNVIEADFTNCIIENNTAEGFAVFSGFNSCGVVGGSYDFDFDRCIVRDNYSSTLSTMFYPASGGNNITATGSISNSLFHDNETGDALGSCIYMVTSTSSGGTAAALTLNISNNTFANNTSTNGSVFYTLRANSSTFKNNIVWGNGSTTPFNGTPTAIISANNLIEGGIGGSLNVDPQFADAPNDDYSLLCTSPAIGAGDGTGLSTTIDLHGNPRLDETLDLGAYEYPAGFSASATESSVCQGDAVTFTTNGVTNISWTGGVTNGVAFYPTATETYTVTGTDGNGCVNTRDVTVEVDASVSDDNVTAQSEVCTGTSATVNVAGSTLGAAYYLRDNSNNSVVDGPTTGTGNALAFSTGNLTSNTTYNVYAVPGPPPQSALSFDGTSGYADIGAGNRNITTQISIETWIKTGSSLYRLFISKYTGTLGVHMYMDANGKVNIAGRDGVGARNSGASTTSINDNQWHHVVGTVNVTTGIWRVYIDGVDETPSPSQGAGTTLASTSPFYIGANSLSGAPYEGTIGKAVIWNIELSPTTIASNTDGCLDENEAGVVGYFDLNEGSGTTIADRSGNGDGTLINMTPATDWVAGQTYNCNITSCNFELSQTVTVGVTSGHNLTETESVCEGVSFTFPDGTSQTITSQVVHTSNLVTVIAGCDSIIETTVNVSPSYDLTEAASVCSGESFTFPDGSTQQNITSQVVYTSNLQTVGTSCDSIIETTVNVDPTYDLTETASVCSGQSFTFPDGSSQTITSQVVYTSNLSTVNTSCDSIIETTVNVAPEYNLTETIGLCSGADFTFPDGTMQNNITSQVVHTSNLVTVGTQCDSIIETTLTITSAFNVSETVSVCSGSTYTFPDGTMQNNITSQVVYSSTLAAVSIPCDSIVETTVNIAPDYSLSETVSACMGESYTFPDGSSQTITSQTIYTSNLTTVSTSCDSIIEITVNVNPTYDLTETASLCSGESFTFPDGSTQQNITSQVVYTSSLATVVTQCDSIIETTVNVTTVDESTTQNGNTLTATESGADYQWVDCGNSNAPISGAENQDFTPTASGNYAVEVTVNNCTETSGCVNMIVTGIREVSTMELNIFPVPAREQLNVVCNQTVETLEVYTVSGKLVGSYPQNTKTIDVSAFAGGMYVLRVRTESGTSQTRFVKQ